MIYRDLDSIVYSICELIGDDNHKKYAKVLKSCARFMERFNCFHSTPYFRSTNLKVSNNYTVQMPEDCMRPIKVGICIDGKIRGFYYNQELCAPNDSPPSCTCDDNESVATSTPCAFCCYPNYYNNPSAVYNTRENYSASPYQTAAGWFKYDLVNDRIIFDANSNIQPDEEVVLMYKSSTITSKGKIVVPTEFFEPMKYHVKSELDSKGFREEMAYKQKSEAEELGVIRLYGRMTTEELEAAIGGYKKSAPLR